MRGALQRIFVRRGLAPAPEDEARIAGCSDMDQLQQWLIEATVAVSVQEALAK